LAILPKVSDATTQQIERLRTFKQICLKPSTPHDAGLAVERSPVAVGTPSVDWAVMPEADEDAPFAPQAFELVAVAVAPCLSIGIKNLS
jgi:hypothetical protein